MQKQYIGGKVKECCKHEPNLMTLPQDRRDVLTKVCKVCLCRHTKMWAEPGAVGARMRR